MNKLYLVIIFLIIQSSLFSQITLDSNNFPYADMSYSRFYLGADTIGPAGIDQYYDFSNAFIAFGDTLHYLDATSTPFYSEHTSSEMALYFNDGGGTERYYYYTKDTNAFWENGLSIIADFGSGLDTVHSVYDPMYVDTLLSNQYTYGHNETEHTIATITINPAVYVDLHKVKEIQVDAWGSMDTPFNHFDDMLRVKYVDYRYDSVFIAGTFDSANLDTLYYYHYYAKDIPHPVVIAHTDSLSVLEYLEIIYPQPIIYGCTDTLAVNYSPIANSDDGTCIYCTPISYTATPDTSICSGDSVTLSVSGGFDWNWSTGDTTSTITISPDSTTIYSVYIGDQPLCWEIENIIVSVSNIITAGFWISSNNFSIDDSVQFINTSINASDYFWDFDDDIDSISFLENPNHKYSSVGDKNIMLISSNYCYTDTSYKTISITNINEIEKLISNLNIYPNPGDNNSTIEFDLNKQSDIEISIYDIYGKLCASKVLDYYESNIKISDISQCLPSGMYIISIRAEQELMNVKWIKL